MEVFHESRLRIFYMKGYHLTILHFCILWTWTMFGLCGSKFWYCTIGLHTFVVRLIFDSNVNHSTLHTTIVNQLCKTNDRNTNHMIWCDIWVGVQRYLQQSSWLIKLQQVSYDTLPSCHNDCRQLVWSMVFWVTLKDMFSDMNHDVHVLLLCYMHSYYWNICNRCLRIT